MQRSCDSCGVTYEAKRKTSKYCSKRCNVRAARAPKPVDNAPKPVEIPPDDGFTALIRTTERDLGSAGRLDTILGRQAVELARRICSPHETGAAIASLSKEFRAVMEVALEGVGAAANPLDELRDRRDRKRAAG